MRYIIVNTKDTMYFNKQLTKDMFHFVRDITDSKIFKSKWEAKHQMNKLQHLKNREYYRIEVIK